MSSERKSKGESIEQSKVGTPVFHSPYEGRFRDPEEAKRVLRAVANFFRAGSANPSGGRVGGFLGFAIENTMVKPSTKISRVRLETSFASGSAILHVPRRPDESEEEFQARELRILSQFSTTIFEAQMRSALEFFWSLDEEGRKTLVASYADPPSKQEHESDE